MVARMACGAPNSDTWCHWYVQLRHCTKVQAPHAPPIHHTIPSHGPWTSLALIICAWKADSGRNLPGTKCACTASDAITWCFFFVSLLAWLIVDCIIRSLGRRWKFQGSVGEYNKGFGGDASHWWDFRGPLSIIFENQAFWLL